MRPFLRLFASSLFIVPLLLGCKTISNPALLDFVAARAGQAVKIAVLADLKSNPGHAPAYGAAVQALDGLLRSTNYSSAAFKEILAQLPIKEFRGDTGALVIEGGLLIFDLVTMFAFDPQSQPALLAVMLQVRDGLIEALVQSQPGQTAKAETAPWPRSGVERIGKAPAADKPETPLIPKRTRRI